MTFVLHFMYICSTNDYDCHTYVIQNNKAMKKEGKRMYSYRVPESLYDEIDRMVKLRINEYERELLTGEKKSNPTDNSLELGSVVKVDGKEATIVSQIGTSTKFSGDDFKHIVYKDNVVESKKIEPQVVEETKIAPDAKKEKVKALQEMADLIKNGSGPKNIPFTTVKKTIDEIYDCVPVERGIPVEGDRIYYGTNNRIAFWDRDDATVFYVNWEGKYYRFVNSSQFNKFCKDNNLK